MISFLVRHIRAVYGFVILVTLVALVGMTRLKPGFLDALPLPPSEPAVAANQAIGDRFGGMEGIILTLESEDALSPRSLEALEALTKAAEKIPGVRRKSDVVSLTRYAEPVKEGGTFGARPIVRNPEDRPALLARIRADRFASQALLAKDTKAALVFVTLGDRSYPDPLFEREYLRELTEFVRVLIADHTQEGRRVSATGVPLVMYQSMSNSGREMTVLAIIGCLLLLGVFYLHSGTLLGTLIPFGIMSLSVIWTLGAMGWLAVDITPVTVFVVAIVLSAGSSYPLHVIAAGHEFRREEAQKVNVLRYTFTETATALLLVSMTSALSGITLLTFSIRDIRLMGIFGAFGITVSYALSLYFIPVVLYSLYDQVFPARALTPQPQRPGSMVVEAVHRGMGRVLDAISYLPLRAPWVTLVLCVGLVAGGTWGVNRVRADWEVVRTIPRGTLAQEGYLRVAEHFGPLLTLNILVERADHESLLQTPSLLVLKSLEDELSSLPGVVTGPTVATILERVSRVMFGRELSSLQSDQIDQLLLSMGRSRLGRVIDLPGRGALLTLVVSRDRAGPLSSLLEKLREVSGRFQAQGYQVQVSGSAATVNAINRYMIYNKLQSIVTCLVIVFALLVLMNASWTIGLVGLLPAASAAWLTFGLMGIFDIPLDTVNATVTTVAIGVGVDFAVHFLLKYRSAILSAADPQSHAVQVEALRKTVGTYGKTIFFDLLTNVASLGILLFSLIPALRMSGLLLILNQGIVIFTTFFLLPALILILKPGHAPSRFAMVR